MDRAPVTIRASSLGALFDCPTRWCAIHLEGRRVPSNGKAALGRSIHAGTAVFDADRVRGVLPSLSAAEDAAVEALRKPGEEVVWDEEAVDKAEGVARSLTGRYCTLESPRHEFVAVEASVEALHITDLGLVLAGTTDRVRRTEAGYGIADLKSGKQAVGTDGRAKTKGHASQLGVYELVAQAATKLPIDAPALVIGLQTNLTPDKQRIGTAEIEGAREVLLGDESHSGLLHTAARIVHGEIEPWGNPQSVMCHATYCPNFNSCFWRR
ncbi:MAG: PD-(D/E)XK nuclease family protein [Piscinibacter sp.]|nr:PD-(D/E)XK nuclease family protein [Piscinibacter sp.]